MTQAVILPDDALGLLPKTLRSELLDEYNGIVASHRAGRWGPAQLDGGKLCEIVYSILKGHVEGAFPTRASKPRNMVDACRGLEAASGFPRSVRITLPRAIIALYELRSNRSVGHVGGDVDPNHMDSAFVLGSARWIVAELVRIFHDTDTETAAEVVDALTQRETPLVWSHGTLRRILDPSITAGDQVLLLCLGQASAVAVSDLLAWIEYANGSRFRNSVLGSLHKKRLIEFDQKADAVVLTTTGEAVAESLMSP